MSDGGAGGRVAEGRSRRRRHCRWAERAGARPGGPRRAAQAGAPTSCSSSTDKDKCRALRPAGLRISRDAAFPVAASLRDAGPRRGATRLLLPPGRPATIPLTRPAPGPKIAPSPGHTPPARTDGPPPPTSARSAAPGARPGEAAVLWVIWLTYGSFYFCRQNISAAVPGLKACGLNPVQIGWILGGLKIAYAVGQLVNGQLAERLPARWLLAVGMLGSAGAQRGVRAGARACTS